MISDLISDDEFDNLEKKRSVKYTNPSINDREMTLTIITSSNDFIMEIFSLLVSAEEAIKSL